MVIAIEDTGRLVARNQRRGEYQLRIALTSDTPELAANAVLDWIAEGRGAAEPPTPVPGRAFDLGGWPIQFVATAPSTIELWEAALPGNNFRRGIDNALKCWQAQRSECFRAGSAFAPPPSTSTAVCPSDFAAGTRPGFARLRPEGPGDSGWRPADGHAGAETQLSKLLVTDAMPFLALAPGHVVEPGWNRRHFEARTLS